jgi:hypothetical protein
VVSTCLFLHFGLWKSAKSLGVLNVPAAKIVAPSQSNLGFAGPEHVVFPGDFSWRKVTPDALTAASNEE